MATWKNLLLLAIGLLCSSSANGNNILLYRDIQYYTIAIWHYMHIVFTELHDCTAVVNA